MGQRAESGTEAARGIGALAAGLESCPNCGERALPASGHLGGFVTEDIEFSMPAHCLTCRWQGPEPVPLVGGGQGRTPAENEATGNALAGVVIWLGIAACIAVLVLGAIWLCGHTDVAPFSELPR